MVTNRYWPFNARSAFVTSLVLVPALVALAVWLYRPNGPVGTGLNATYLLAAVLLGLLPVLLVILGGVGSLEAAGVKVSFMAVQEVVSSSGVATARSHIAENLGSPPGRVTGTGSDTIIDSLKGAVANYCVVADLKEGEEWWDTRLLVLVSGAHRLGFPKAIVFTAVSPDKPQRFVGWAAPGELLRRFLASKSALSSAYHAAQRDWMLWQLGNQKEPGAQRLLPWAPSGKMQAHLPLNATLPQLAARMNDNTIEYPWPSPEPQQTPWVMREDGFEAERLLLNRLQPLEASDAKKALTEANVRELFGSVLQTEFIDADDEDAWIEVPLASTGDFLAVTRRGQFVNLAPRPRAVDAIVMALVSEGRRADGQTDRHENKRRPG